MTTNHTLGIPLFIRERIDVETKNIFAKVGANELPPYVVFVHNLMKGLNTPQEEMHHAATGISGEAGEILEISKKVWIYGKELDVLVLLKELGDLRFYYQAMLNFLELDDEDVKAHNMIKLSARYADGKYSDAQANARADVKPAPRKFIGMPTPTPTPTPTDRSYQTDTVAEIVKMQDGTVLPSPAKRPQSRVYINGYTLEEAADDLAKWNGTPPHNVPSNPCVGDGFFLKTMETKYGMTPEELGRWIETNTPKED